MVLLAGPASAAVSVSRAEVSAGTLRLDGTATARRDIRVDGAVLGRSDSRGRFAIVRSGYTPPADCTVDVNDGSATPRVATLTGCSTTAPPSAPAAPAQLAPANGASVTTPVTLSWSAVLDPAPASQNGGYNWEIATSATFTTLVTRDSTLPGVTQESVGQLAPGTYHWRVQAVDGALRVGPWSSTRSFVVTGAGPGALAAPVLAALPFGTAYHPMETFPFSWGAVPGAASYVVEASRNAAFPAPVEVRFDNITAPTYSLTMHDSLTGSWNLRVRAIGADGVAGPASDVRTFTISYSAPVGPPPILVAPADGATVSLPFVLDWDDVPNPQSSGYTVEIARDPGFGAVEAQSAGLTDSRWTVLGLSAGTKYWRVRHAYGNASPTTAALSAPSTVRSFTLGSGPSGVASVRLLDSPTAHSGTERVGEVQLTALAPAGGAVVGLSSTDPSAVPVPATVTVPAGQSVQQFRFSHGQVTQPTPVTVTAILDGSTATTSITVLPSSLKSVGPGGNTVTGGATGSAFVELDGAAPGGGADVTLTSSSPLASPPATVTVPAGGFLQHFAIPTTPVPAPTTVTLTASWRGGQATHQLVLNPGVPPAVWTVEKTPTTGSEGSSARVAIDTVQTTDTTFTLTSSDPAVARMAPSVTIPAGSPHAGVLIHTTNPAAPTTVTLSVAGGGGTRTATLTVNPIPLAPLPAPTLVAPASGSRFGVGQSIPFDWSDVPDAASYTLQVGSSTTFTTVLVTRTVTASQLGAALTATGDRSWRVRAHRVDGSPGAWSPARSIRVG
ncbi:hypothetical protein [Geodermatophilus sabuli]|nr:hypothetical protein [Geodermatophilus sabuli]